MDYRVTLDIFDGPLDLLLHLIRRHELDVCDVALAGITDRYLRHVAVLRELSARGEGGGVDLDTVGDFLVVAATLLEIKSNELLPRPEAEQSNVEAVDPASLGDARLELVRQLLEYKRLRDSADRLEAMREEFSQRFPRVPAARPAADDDAGPPPLALEELHVWDLLATFEKLMAELGRRGPARHEVTVDDTPIDLHAADIADRVAREGRVSFRSLLIGRKSRGEMIGVFLALLELVRQKRVLVTSDGDDVRIADAPQEHKDTFEEQTFSQGDRRDVEPAQ